MKESVSLDHHIYPPVAASLGLRLGSDAGGTPAAASAAMTVPCASDAGDATSAADTTADVAPWPTDPAAYDVVAMSGRGVSATVYEARVRGTGARVALKTIRLDTLSTPVEAVTREVAAMRALQHPAILLLHTSFVADRELFMVTPFCSGGTVGDALRRRFPNGMGEGLIAAIGAPVLRALAYVHSQGAIHRDIKASNILVDGDGSVLLGDFGVAATLERDGSWGNGVVGRTTVVGTPCHISPEVLAETDSYSSPADIWSFGITLMEMARGRAPFAKMPPLKALLQTLQSPPPRLEARCGEQRFSRALRDAVALCLQKDPQQRPTAAQLLKHRFFRNARGAPFVKRHLLGALPEKPAPPVPPPSPVAMSKALLSSDNADACDSSDWDFSLPAAYGCGSGCDGLARTTSLDSQATASSTATSSFPGTAAPSRSSIAGCSPRSPFNGVDVWSAFSSDSGWMTSDTGADTAEPGLSPDEAKGCRGPPAARAASLPMLPLGGSSPAPLQQRGRFTMVEANAPFVGPELFLIVPRSNSESNGLVSPPPSPCGGSPTPTPPASPRGGAPGPHKPTPPCCAIASAPDLLHGRRGPLARGLAARLLRLASPAAKTQSSQHTDAGRDARPGGRRGAGSHGAAASGGPSLRRISASHPAAGQLPRGIWRVSLRHKSTTVVSLSGPAASPPPGDAAAHGREQDPCKRALRRPSIHRGRFRVIVQ